MKKLTKAADSIFTLYQENRMVVTQRMCKTNSEEEVQEVLEGVAGRLKELGYDGPLMYSTDDCCHEEKMLMRVFSTLRSHRFSVLEQDVLPTLTLPTYEKKRSWL
mmetsp:Transcript_4484/g.14038  ORF Transcript_4484/g.14038 Transcript_4484/m.14038 type:complete len:105 (+) Transcript_4484:1497-1811(+)